MLGKFFHRQTIRLLERADTVVATSPDYIDGSRYLYEDGYSYGPMITLPRGSYRLTIRGEGLSDISFIPTAGKGAYVSDAMEVQKDNDIAVYEFCFDEYSEQVEFVIINEGSGEVRLDSVDLSITAR